MTDFYKKACVHYRGVLSPQTFEWLGTQSMHRSQCIWCILAVKAYFLQLYSDICLGQYHPCPHLWTHLKYLSKAQESHTLPYQYHFRKTASPFWLVPVCTWLGLELRVITWPPCVNVFCASQLWASLGGHQLEPCSQEHKCKFASVMTQVLSAVVERREGSNVLPTIGFTCGF